MQTESARTENPLGCQPIGRLLLQFALPSVISMLVNAVYNIVDQIFIGQGVGYLGNAATTIAFPVVTIMLAAATMFGAGGSAYASIKLGEKKEEEAGRTLGSVFWMLVVSGIIIAALGLLFLDPVLKLFGATDTTMAYARDYTAIILIGSPFNMLGVGLSNMARADGKPALSMYSILVGAVLNTILDPVYIFVFHWGVKGAAIATITSQIISALVLLWYFFRKGTMRLNRQTLRPRPRICLKVCALGLSSCFLQLASTLLQIVMNNSLVYYGALSTVGGDAALSAMGIVMKINMILISICIGIGIGSQPILGFNRGADKPKRIRKTYLTAVTISTAVSAIGWVVCLFIPHIVLRLFGTADANFTAFGIRCMRIFLAGMFCAGFQIVSTSYFQATGQALKATVLSLLRQLILLIPLLVVLPLFFGLDGILYAGPIADISAGAIVFVFVVLEMRKLNRHIKEQDMRDAAVPTLQQA